MKIGLHDSEKNNFPNLALMKLSAWHKAQGDTVEWYAPENKYDKIYSAKVFTYTSEETLPKGAFKGGTGYRAKRVLPKAVEHICPDYSLYNCQASYGFLTRGCPNKCPWCFVPEKEGGIKAHADIGEFARHKEVILMDNNVLAHKHGIVQIEKIVKLGLKIDFNQGLDARRIDAQIAKLLSKVKWINSVRLACDQMGQIESVKKAVELLRWYNCTPRKYFVYAIIRDVDEALERIKILKGINVNVFAQPYRDKLGTPSAPEQRRLSRYVNRASIFNTVSWEDYKTPGWEAEWRKKHKKEDL